MPFHPSPRPPGIEVGRAEGMLAGRRAAIVQVVGARFGGVPPELESRLAATADLGALDRLLLQAATCATPDDLARGTDAG